MRALRSVVLACMVVFLVVPAASAESYPGGIRPYFEVDSPLSPPILPGAVSTSVAGVRNVTPCGAPAPTFSSDIASGSSTPSGYPTATGSIPVGRAVLARPSPNPEFLLLHADRSASARAADLCIAMVRRAPVIEAFGELPATWVFDAYADPVGVNVQAHYLAQAPLAAVRAFNEAGGIGAMADVRVLQMDGYEYLAGLCMGAICDTRAAYAGSRGTVGFFAQPGRLLDFEGTMSGAAHEFYHAVDQALGYPNLQSEWRDLVWPEAQSCYPDPYYTGMSGEWWAESLNIYSTSPTFHRWLQVNCPKTWQYHNARFGNPRWRSYVGWARLLPWNGAQHVVLRDGAACTTAPAGSVVEVLPGSTLDVSSVRFGERTWTVPSALVGHWSSAVRSRFVDPTLVQEPCGSGPDSTSPTAARRPVVTSFRLAARSTRSVTVRWTRTGSRAARARLSVVRVGRAGVRRLAVPTPRMIGYVAVGRLVPGATYSICITVVDQARSSTSRCLRTTTRRVVRR